MNDMAGAGKTTNITSLGGGYFNVGGKKVAFGDMVFLAQLDSINTMDQIFAVKYDEISKKNAKIQELNQIYADLNTMKEYGESQKTQKITDPTVPWYVKHKDVAGDNLPANVGDGEDDGGTGEKTQYDFRTEFFGKGGWNDKYFKTGEINVTLSQPMKLSEVDSACTAVQSSLNSLNSQTTLDMTQMNRMSSNRATGIQLLTSLLSTLKESRQAAARG